MWERLRRFNSLEPGARGLFLRAVTLLPIISFSLHFRGFRATQLSLQRFIRRSTHNASTEQATTARVAMTARMVRSAAYRGFGNATCLEKSLALWWLLGRQGIISSVRIGSRKSGDKFEAHAWVEHAGVALNEPEEQHLHYEAFDEAFPSASLPPGSV